MERMAQQVRQDYLENQGYQATLDYLARLKSKLISNQDQWVETFKSIQEPKQLPMVNAGESTIIIDVDESYRHNCLSLYFYYILSIFDYLIIIKILMVIEFF